eukprot:c19896_g3_i1 orf=267-677(-)
MLECVPTHHTVAMEIDEHVISTMDVGIAFKDYEFLDAVELSCICKVTQSIRSSVQLDLSLLLLAGWDSSCGHFSLCWRTMNFCGCSSALLEDEVTKEWGIYLDSWYPVMWVGIAKRYLCAGRHFCESVHEGDLVVL